MLHYVDVPEAIELLKLASVKELFTESVSDKFKNELEKPQHKPRANDGANRAMTRHFIVAVDSKESEYDFQEEVGTINITSDNKIEFTFDKSHPGYSALRKFAHKVNTGKADLPRRRLGFGDSVRDSDRAKADGDGRVKKDVLYLEAVGEINKTTLIEEVALVDNPP